MPTTLNLTGQLAPREAWTSDHCNIARTLDVISARSAFLILREAFFGTMRFDDFAERVGISEPVAAARLHELVEQGLLEREDYREPGQRTRQQYRLTEKGADLFPALAALMQWGDRWLDDGHGPIELRHHGCGETVSVQLRCASGHHVSTGDLDVALPAPARAAPNR
jgi:DNA-binding HxlR family transcriptional regulator